MFGDPYRDESTANMHKGSWRECRLCRNNYIQCHACPGSIEVDSQLISLCPNSQPKTFSYQFLGTIYSYNANMLSMRSVQYNMMHDCTVLYSYPLET